MTQVKTALIVSAHSADFVWRAAGAIATATANAAIELLSGQTPQATTTLFNTPSQLYIPTVVTKDKRPSAQFEHTLLVTEDGAEVLTLP